MRLGMQLGYDDPIGSVAMAQEADRLGFDSVWTSEAWGADAVTVASWIAATTEQIGIGTAIMQMPARTPATTAMTVATLDQLSGGRVLLGLGTSGPQVVEGWHGVPWGKPLGRTREYVEIVRAALRRETVEHHGPHYDIPYSGEDATGVGKPLKLILKPLRRDVPIYLAAMGPRTSPSPRRSPTAGCRSSSRPTASARSTARRSRMRRTTSRSPRSAPSSSATTCSNAATC